MFTDVDQLGRMFENRLRIYDGFRLEMSANGCSEETLARGRRERLSRCVFSRNYYSHAKGFEITRMYFKSEVYSSREIHLHRQGANLSHVNNSETKRDTFSRHMF